MASTVKEVSPEPVIKFPESRLAAKSMVYDSCPMIGFDIEKVAELINLPEDHVMGPMVAVGRGAKDPWPKPGQLTLEEVVFENGF